MCVGKVPDRVKKKSNEKCGNEIYESSRSYETLQHVFILARVRFILTRFGPPRQRGTPNSPPRARAPPAPWELPRPPRGAERPRASAERLGAFTGGRSTPRTRHFCAALLEYPSRASLRPSHALSSTRRSTDDADARKPQRPTADGDAAAREPRSLARISHLPSAPPPRTRTPGEGRAQSQAK